MDLSLDVLELDDRQQPDDDQENHRLGGGRALVLTDESVGINLVDKNGRRLLRSAAGDRVNDAERFKEGVNDVDDQQEERCWRQERKNDCPESLPEACAVDRGSLDNGSGYCL